MTSYRFRRRSFLASLGGAFGLSTLLSNLEASAEGAGSPPRFLMLFWPVGTVAPLFRPQGAGRDYTPSAILQPFETAGLRDDTIVLFGTADHGVSTGNSGGSEGGVVLRTTGAPIPGTRVNGGEADDALAGGPSFDQIFLKHVPELSRADSAVKFVNAIGDARVDSKETSSVCLSYGYATRTVTSVRNGDVTENIPLLPELSPAQAYAKTFAGFMPGGATDTNRQELIRALQLRKSVLDYALGELARIKQLAPAGESDKIDFHAEAIRKVEQQLTDELRGGSGSCALPQEPDPALSASSGSKFYYGNAEAEADESARLAELGSLHLGIIRAAFQCDVLRVATFMWASSVNQVAFGGMHPAYPDRFFRHHPLSHQVSVTPDPLPAPGPLRDTVEFLANVHTWFNQRTAEFLKTLKETRDVFGASLLDNTIIPFVTDTASTSHARSPLPSLIFGGRKLGMQGGQYLNFEGAVRKHNDVWLSIAQAYLPNVDVMATLADEAFAKSASGFTGPIPGLWSNPV
ncbi:MAG TPA: DUF1552 domain-containing protein [Polyangiaceae bacterium]|nr:DUF1552 domain-containing protein [Polyangiaceae bacterium]